MGSRAWAAAAGVMPIGIDRVREADLPAVIAIERDVFSDPWSIESFREALAHSAVYFGCARSGGGGVDGYVVAWYVADEGEIANIAVARSSWGSGVGQALLDAALDEGRARGAVAIYLEVRESNERARRLYRSRAFEEVGRRRGYYRHPVEDAIVLRRTLTQDV